MIIDEINIGQKLIGVVKERYAGFDANVTDKTSNSIEVYIKAISTEGVSCKQWLTIKDFQTFFKFI